ncbi:GHMP kinase [Melampsora americana]|nr:GHMP kinase [Melampsora americana]
MPNRKKEPEVDLIKFNQSLIPDVYLTDEQKSHSKRLDRLIHSFRTTYQHPPYFFVRSPGRVNIIGEHIDYCGFSVLPTAIEFDLMIACSFDLQTDSTSEDQYDIPTQKPFSQSVEVSLSNSNPQFQSHQFSFTFDSNQTHHHIPRCPQGGWVNYVKASLESVLNSIENVYQGLSSSATMTIGSVLSFIRLLNPKSKLIKKHLVIKLAIESERLCGISVGGMDQTASVFGEINKLLHIQFTPDPKVIPISFPTEPPSTFVIANSLIKSTKLDAAKHQYNLRVIETRIGSKLILKHFLPKSSKKHQINLKEIMDQIGLETETDVLTHEILGDENGLGIDQVLEKLEISMDQFVEEVEDGIEAIPFKGKYMVFNRIRHVLTEAKRVEDFKDLILNQSTEPNDLLEQLGNLMNLSHQSCAQDYQCSSPELDELIKLGSQYKSLGSRLTGAGWGGSTIHLVKDEDLNEFLIGLKTDYYLKHFPNLNQIELDLALFNSKPSSGSCILDSSFFLM